jgi:hypothetical protein
MLVQVREQYSTLYHIVLKLKLLWVKKALACFFTSWLCCRCVCLSLQTSSWYMFVVFVTSGTLKQTQQLYRLWLNHTNSWVDFIRVILFNISLTNVFETTTSSSHTNNIFVHWRSVSMSISFKNLLQQDIDWHVINDWKEVLICHSRLRRLPHLWLTSSQGNLWLWVWKNDHYPFCPWFGNLCFPPLLWVSCSTRKLGIKYQFHDWYCRDFCLSCKHYISNHNHPLLAAALL